MAKSKIEWTQEVWNPIAGCNDVSPGCTNCYARGMAGRLEAMGSAKYAGLTGLQGSHRVWTGKIAFDEKALMAPLARKKPTTYFVNSMSDLFHPNVTDQIRDKVFGVIGMCPQHTFQILTKRPEVAFAYYKSRSWDWARGHFIELPGKSAAGECVRRGMEAAWLGASTENQKTFDERIPYLAAIDARIRFLSVEPMLGPINTRKVITPHGWVATSNALARIGWAIAGGESGHHARPMHPDWVRDFGSQVRSAGVPFFFKQWGEFAPYASEFAGDRNEKGKWDMAVNPDGSVGHVSITSNGNVTNYTTNIQSGFHCVTRVGKKAAGHLLDGIEYHQLPEAK